MGLGSNGLTRSLSIVLSPVHLIIYRHSNDRNFKYILRRDHQKNSYERRDYESVDEKAYLRLCTEKRQKKNLVHKG